MSHHRSNSGSSTDISGYYDWRESGVGKSIPKIIHLSTGKHGKYVTLNELWCYSEGSLTVNYLVTKGTEQ
jgi:hypothetical protein